MYVLKFNFLVYDMNFIYFKFLCAIYQISDLFVKYFQNNEIKIIIYDSERNIML